MNCPKCGKQMTQLFTSSVCDHCDPPKQSWSHIAAATPARADRLLNSSDVLEAWGKCDLTTIIRPTGTPGGAALRHSIVTTQVMNQKRKHRVETHGPFTVDELDYGIDGGAPGIILDRDGLCIQIGLLNYDDQTVSAYALNDEGDTLENYPSFTLKNWNHDSIYAASLACLMTFGVVLSGQERGMLQRCIETYLGW